MKKVLITASGFSHIVSFHLPYLRSLRDRGWEVHLCCGGEPTGIDCADQLFSVPFTKSMLSPANLRVSRTIHRLCREHDYDLLITHTSLAAFFTRLGTFALRKRPRVINVVHGYLFDDSDSLPRRLIMEGAERLLAGHTDLVLTMNEYDYRWATVHRAAPQVKSIHGMGVALSPRESAERADLGLGEDDYVMIFPAEFSPRKNQAMLIRALPRLPRCCKLLLPGQGELLGSCKALAGELGVEDRVIFPGFVRDIGSLLAVSDLAVSSSRYEGLPFNVMEAMAFGLPRVVSDVKGNRDLVKDGVSGFLFPYGDVAAFAAAVRRLLDEPELQKSMGQRSREDFDAYRLENVFPEVMEAYLSVL